MTKRVTYEGPHQGARLPTPVEGPDGELVTTVARGETVEVPDEIADGLTEAAGFSVAAAKKPAKKKSDTASAAGEDETR